MDIMERIIRIGLISLGTSGRLAAIKEEASTIRYIKKPSEKEQLTALDGNPLYIQFIENPTPNVQAFAINQNPDAIKYIKNPTVEVAMLAKLSE